MKVLIFLIATLSVNNLIAQDIESAQSTYKNNLLYVNAGPGNYTVNYERTIFSIEGKLTTSINIHAGAGQSLNFSGSGHNSRAHISLSGSTGKKNNHLIYGIGLGGMDLISDSQYKINLSNYYYFTKTGGNPGEKPERYVTYTAFKLGYRHLKPQGKFMFNAGVGFPEFLFVGAGLAF